jgi:hypothetical protein
VPGVRHDLARRAPGGTFSALLWKEFLIIAACFEDATKN